MHRFRSWTLDPPEWRTQRNRLLPAEGGDGSTLSLDFTTGVLDPRLTFMRTTNATFINSSGLVEWANANMYWNTAFEGLSGTNPTLGAGPPATGWSYAFAGSSGNAVFNGNGTVTVTTTGSTTNDRRAIQRSSGFLGAGLRIVVSVDVLISSGTLQPGDVLWTGTPNNYAFYVNGSLYTSGSLPVGTAFNLSLAFDSNSGGTSNAFFGIGCSGGIAGSATFSNPRWTMWKGSGTVPYYPNTSATNNSTADYFKSNSYHAPRFDYDPTSIGTPRGLLIEGSSDNQIRNSNDIYNTSFWGSSVGVSATQDTTIPDPSGGTTTCKIVKSAGVQYVVRNQPIPTLTVPANSTVNLTASVWLRMDGAGQVSPHLGIYDAAGASFGTRSGASVSNSAVTIDSGSAAIATYTFGSVTGWVRCSVSRSFTNSTASPVTFTQLSIYIYPNQVNTNAATIYAWGAQVESGVGASSLIPTGASTGKRELESCALALSAIPFVTSEGSFVVRYDAPRANLGASGTSILNTDYQANKWIGLFQAVNGVTVSLGSWNNQSNISAGTVTSNIAAFSYGAWTGSLVPVSFVVNNSTVTNANRDWNPALPTWLMFGAASAAGSSTANRDWLNSCIRSVKYWPTRLPDAQLKSLTT